MSMTLKELQNELARWDYKPGWRLEIVAAESFGPPWARFVLVVGYETDDSRTPGLKAKIGSRHDLPGEFIETSQEFGRFLQDILTKVERHESREWLRRDGEIFDDPHKDGAR